MALWPFRRKTVHSPTRTSHLNDSEDSPTRRHGASPRRTDSSRNNRASAPVPRASVRKKQRPEANKLQRRVRNYSFSPNRREVIQVDPRSRPQQNQNDQGDSPWTRAPTLYLKRDPRNPPVARRRSSKRRHEDHEREAEIKAMSYYMPSASSDRPLYGGGKYGIKRSKTSRHSDQTGKRNSDISLPLPDSLQSSLSGDSDMTSYQVSIFDSLAPRPTLRYGIGIKRAPSRASASTHPASTKGLLLGVNAISEEVMHPRKRIDDLADDLDAKALRELMDRDTKRRQRARTQEQAKTEKKIADAAERYKQEADDARKSGSPSPSNMERGVIGRELIGLGLDPASAVVTSSRQRTSQSSEPTAANESQPPLQVFHRVDTLPNQDADRDTEASSGRLVAQSIDQQEPNVAAPPVSRFSGLLRTKKSRSKSTLASDKDKLTVPNDGECARKGSEASMGKSSRLSISSLLKWNSRNKRNSGPPSFSNTSREEMQAVASAQAQAEALARLQGDDLRSGSADNLRSGSSLSGNYVAGKLNAAAKRTRSRFREDLDDFPTPPDSRVESPDAEPLISSVADSNYGYDAQPIPIPGHGMPSAFAQRSVEKLRERALTGGSGSYTAPSPDQNLSMSLASIDSEGSWLSGGAGIRRSGAIRDSLLRANRQAQRDSSPAPSLDEDLGITEDEYMTRLAPAFQSHGAPKRRSEEGRPSSDEDERELKWGAVGARPQFIHRANRGTVHSQQALVNIDSADEESIIEACT